MIPSLHRSPLSKHTRRLLTRRPRQQSEPRAVLRADKPTKAVEPPPRGSVGARLALLTKRKAARQQPARLRTRLWALTKNRLQLTFRPPRAPKSASAWASQECKAQARRSLRPSSEPSRRRPGRTRRASASSGRTGPGPRRLQPGRPQSSPSCWPRQSPRLPAKAKSRLT